MCIPLSVYMSSHIYGAYVGSRKRYLRDHMSIHVYLSLSRDMCSDIYGAYIEK